MKDIGIGKDFVYWTPLVSEEGPLEEGACKGDDKEERGGEVSGQQLLPKLSLQLDGQEDQVVTSLQGEVGHGEHRHVFLLRGQLVKLLGHIVAVDHPHLFLRLS